MNHIRKALLVASSAAKLGAMSTDASAACANNLFGLSVQGDSSIFTPATAANSSTTDTSKGGTSSTSSTTSTDSSKGDTSSTSSTAATIIADKLTKTSTLDFTVVGIPMKGVSTVYIAYSTARAAAGAWPASCKGKLELDAKTLEIAYGSTLNATEQLVGKVSMGVVVPDFASYTISIKTEDLLANTKLEGNHIYFQAMIMEGTAISIANATISPVYEIAITRPTPSTPSTGK